MIPFRCCRAGYIPPRGQQAPTEEIIEEEIERAAAAARNDESFPPPFPPPGPRAPPVADQASRVKANVA
eukprot:8295003-Karenia_brevis.AAC.1